MRLLKIFYFVQSLYHFQESENDPDFAAQAKNNPNLPFSKDRNRENEKDPGKWTQNRVGKKSHAISLDKIPSKPTFAVHQDEGLVTPSKCSATSNVLTSHKPKKIEDDMPVALALFEPPDPTKRPMYCKHLVYQGVTEFQFEELRAARYGIFIFTKSNCIM